MSAAGASDKCEACDEEQNGDGEFGSGVSPGERKRRRLNRNRHIEAGRVGPHLYRPPAPQAVREDLNRDRTDRDGGEAVAALLIAHDGAPSAIGQGDRDERTAGAGFVRRAAAVAVEVDEDEPGDISQYRRER